MNAALERFVGAQAPVYATVLAELCAGRKRTHWMWFVFPQLAGLGRSETARFYAIGSIEEARDYLAHPLLGPRLLECTAAALSSGRAAEALFGYPDDLKFRSCMTLFERAAADAHPFAEALARLCDGERDAVTLRLLEAG
ncbi:MAG: DUF1810 domain-containing protein [Sphingomonas sp.]|uniref:DUF1810 domain-containing protein n=1 Tax=Sphingomonas sp. TaxID=28214 RepID=UPI001B28B234|nr:DUF1810 domain-containing protein [Sphingomonas sp.]MBO9623446.1 DUF1810 domain-containing protein [Sphingomonas sp.]